MATPKQFYDFVAEFSGGINSGVAPILLERNQLSMMVNGSLRGGMAKTRPPIQKKSLIFSDPTLLNLLEVGLFQGASYYRPDFGTESLIAQISGRLIKFTEAGTSWTVSDVSIPGDLNSATANQVWMWQSEKWLIINDGTGVLPIFFDGTTSRRSFGQSEVWGTTSANYTPPAIGAAVTLTLATPYIGQFNVPVIINGEFYQPIQAATPGTYPVVLTNLSAPAGSVVSGTQVTVDPSLVGFATGTPPANPYFPFQPVNKVFASMTSVDGLSVGDIITLTTVKFPSGSGGDEVAAQFKISVLNPNGPKTVQMTLFPTTGRIDVLVHTAGTQQTIVSRQTAQPSVLVGTTNGDFVIPAIGSTVAINISSPYTGANGQAVWIDGQQYSISSPAPVPPGTSLTVINLTDTGVAPVVAPVDILSVPELPAGRMGAYGMARNWFSLIDGISYEAGDIVGGASGTPANNYRDSVLKTTENDFLTGGGTFRLPGTGDLITAMIFPPILDTSLGQGQLQIFTAFSAFSNNSPVDRAAWTALTSPLQTESLKDNGALAQNSTVCVNNDTFFRSPVGYGSLVLAKRQFYDWGNKPISNEMQRILNKDVQSLLSYGSAIAFDNRFLSTCAPNTSSQGVFHSGLVALNFDLMSSMRTALPPAWEGAWSGINVLQILSGRVNGSRRCFAFTYSITDQKIELHELVSENAALLANNFLDDGTTRIGWFFETAVLFNKDLKPLTQHIRLVNGEIALSDIRGPVNISIFYRPVFSTCWVRWRDLAVCSDMSLNDSQPQYRYRLGLGAPDATICDPTNNTPKREALAFQFRVEVEGYCTFQTLRVEAVEIPEPKYAPVAKC